MVVDLPPLWRAIRAWFVGGRPHARVGGDGAPRHRARRIEHAPTCAHAAAHAGTSAGGAGSRVVSGAADRTRGGGWCARGARASRQSWVHAHRAGDTRRAAHATPLPPLPCSPSLPRTLALVPGLASDAPALPCLLPPSAGLSRGCLSGEWVSCSCGAPPSAFFPSNLPGPSPPAGFTPTPSSPRITVPPTRTPRGLAARGVPARARRARAMGVPASRELRLRRRWLLARRLLGVGVLVRWRAALALHSRCARTALALRSRCDTHTPASGKPGPWTVHDDGGSSPSSSPSSCCHCAVIIHANSLARALAVARALSLARDHALATLALCSHSRPRLVAPKRCARHPAPPFARAALSLASPRHLCLLFVRCRHFPSCASLLAAIRVLHTPRMVIQRPCARARHF